MRTRPDGVAWPTPVLLGLLLGVWHCSPCPDSSVKPADMMLVEVDRATSVDTDPDVIWILAVGSDARPGEDHDPHPRRRAPADRHQHQDRCGRRHRHPARLLRRTSRATAATASTRRSYYGGPRAARPRPSATWSASTPSTSSSPSSRSSRRWSTASAADLRRQPGGLQRHLPQAEGLRGGTHPAERLHRARVLAQSRTGLIGGDFDRSANQQRVLQRHPGADPREGADPRLARARRAQRDGQPGHRRCLAGRALPARPRRRLAAVARSSRPASSRAATPPSAARAS